MERVAVVGGPGSGKSTVARLLAERSGFQLVELDALWWEPCWRPADIDKFRGDVQLATAGEEWVVEGNYLSEVGRDIVWPRADTLVWLDPPRWKGVGRTLARTAVRVARRTELWGSNRQGISTLSPSSVAALIRRWPDYSRRVEALLGQDRYEHLAVHRLRTDGEVDDWLRRVGAG